MRTPQIATSFDVTSFQWRHSESVTKFVNTDSDVTCNLGNRYLAAESVSAIGKSVGG